MLQSTSNDASVIGGRYILHDEIEYGGTATIHMGRLLGPVGFARTVAIKRLHGAYARDPEFVTMLMDEARLASRIRHPNVVPIIDVVTEQDELLLVMDYIHGESLARLLAVASKQGTPADAHIISKILVEALCGLHAAHEVKDEDGVALGVVHRDVSPQNILVSVDGVAHLIDFGVAKASGRLQHTQGGQVKGKLRYMAPEQIECGHVDRRTDIFAAAVVLWEALVGRLLFSGTDAQLVFAIMSGPIPRPSEFIGNLPPALDAVVMKGLQRNPNKRFGSALEMADALESALQPAPTRAVARWLQDLAPSSLEKRARIVEEVERSSGHMIAPGLAGVPHNASGSHIKISPVIEVEAAVPTCTADLNRRERETVRAPRGSESSSNVVRLDAPIPTPPIPKVDPLGDICDVSQGLPRRSGRWRIAAGAVLTVVAIGTIVTSRSGGDPTLPTRARDAAAPATRDFANHAVHTSRGSVESDRVHPTLGTTTSVDSTSAPPAARDLLSDADRAHSAQNVEVSGQARSAKGLARGIGSEHAQATSTPRLAPRSERNTRPKKSTLYVRD